MFTHLHLHTQYSLLDGACSIKPLVRRLKQLGMEACAITDHGVMYGVVDFFRACVEEGIHPVIGCEVYVCPDMDEKTSQFREYSHLVLLCKSNEGYKNLSRLVSEGFTRGFYYRPRVDYALLKKYAGGLIALSACLSGDLPKLLLDGRDEDARQMARRYVDIFGEENFYIELQDHGLAEEKQVLPRLVRLAREEGIPLVATNDCHYLTAQDAAAQEILMCIQTGKTLSDPKRMKMTTDQLYVKSEEEMRALFGNFPEALENTNAIAARCEMAFDFSTTHLPRFALPAGETDARAYLARLCREGLARLYGPDRADARERLEYELGVIGDMGYVDYFLIVWDFIHYARTHGIGVGPGRGSGAGSIVAYCLGITAVDPIKYALLFERFLNPERISMPDIDVDFDYRRRGEVIDYVRRRYGEDHVAQIITFGTMAARAVIRDVGRVMDLSYPQTDRIAKMVPAQLGMTLEKALEMSQELRQVYQQDAQVREVIDTARKLEGMPRNASTHAAGVLITGEPVVNYVPLQTNDEVVTTQFPMGTLEALGLLKMDFLGLRTVSVITDAIDMAVAAGAEPFSPMDIPLDDERVYQMISQGDTDGVFQLESSGMKQFLTNMRPENFEDIIAAISLYRPGPMESIPRYIQGKHDPASVSYDTPLLKPILDVTYGCMVYQEQVMQIVRDLAGYSYGRSDLVRRAMSKKKHDVMAREKETFIHGLVENGQVVIPGAVRNGVSEAVAEKIFDEMTAFASYAFNKSHAAAYALVAVQTAYLKVHYPVQFMAALINSEAGNADKVGFYIQTCKKRGIDVLPPDINFSQENFSVEKGAIRFGLCGIKNLGHAAIEAIVREREAGGAYSDLFDLCERVAGAQVNKKCVESLIRAGALDALPGNRAQKLTVYDRAVDGAGRRQKGAVAGQMSLFDFEAVDLAPPPMPERPEFSKQEILRMEKEVTGVYISGHPLDAYEEALSRLPYNSRALRALLEDDADALRYDRRMIALGGIVAECKRKATKSGSMMAFVQLEDLYGQIEVLVFPKVYERCAAQLQQESVALCVGRLSLREESEAKLLLEDVRPLTPQQVEQTLAGLSDEPPTALEQSAPPAPSVESAPSAAEGKLYLRLPDSAREAVLSMLEKTPGEIPVILVSADTGRAQRTPRRYWVGFDCDFRNLENFLGASNVIYK